MTYKKKKSYWQQDIRTSDYWKAFIQGVVIILIISYLFYGNLFYGILFSPYMFKYMKSFEQQKIKKIKESFRLQFKDALQALSSAIHVGYSVENALIESRNELKYLYKEDALIMKELSTIARQIQMNIPAEKALQDFAKRTKEEDVETFVTIFGMAKRTGGDTVEIIQSTISQILEKIDAERAIKTIMTAKQLEFRIMTMIPLGMMAYLKICFPEFLGVLYGNVAGITIMTVCLGIYLLSYEAGKRIVEIEV